MAYTKDTHGNETYGKDANTQDEMIDHGRYAKNKDGDFYYPKKHTHEEFIDPQLGHITKNGRKVLPLQRDGKPIYPKDAASQNDLYPVDAAGKEHFGIGSDGHEYYAKDASGDEFYPSDNQIAKQFDGTPYYAHTGQKQTVFPKENTKEVYIAYVNLFDPCTIPTRYAKDGTTEYYPKIVTQDGYLSDYIVNHTYAQNTNNEPFYPKDAFHNEFYLPDRDGAQALRAVGDLLITGAQKRYAVTNDKKIILPILNHQPTLDATVGAPAVTLSHVVGRLIRIRRQRSDALTSIENPAAPPVDPKAYSYVDGFGVVHKVVPAGSTLPEKPSKVVTAAICKSSIPMFRKWYFWVILVVSVMVKSFLLWWFFIRQQSFYSRIR